VCVCIYIYVFSSFFSHILWQRLENASRRANTKLITKRNVHYGMLEAGCFSCSLSHSSTLSSCLSIFADGSLPLELQRHKFYQRWRKCRSADISTCFREATLSLDSHCSASSRLVRLLIAFKILHKQGQTLSLSYSFTALVTMATFSVS
jgi:hypothetical protein